MTHLLTTLLMLTLTLHGAAMAGPVAAGEADAASAGSTSTGFVSPAATGGSSAATAGAGHGLGQLGGTADAAAAAAAASGPAGSALVLEMLKEAEAGAVVGEAAHPSRRDPARAASAAAAQGGAANKASRDDDPWELREVGKTAMRWAKQAIPWLRSDEDEADAAKEVLLKQADWSASPVGRTAGHGPEHLSDGRGSAQPEAEVVYGEAQRTQQAGADHNLVRQIIDVLRQVLEHPMTWLVVSLFVIGGIVVKRIDRRPTK